jgi:hypothetical protein
MVEREADKLSRAAEAFFAFFLDDDDDNRSWWLLVQMLGYACG